MTTLLIVDNTNKHSYKNLQLAQVQEEVSGETNDQNFKKLWIHKKPLYFLRILWIICKILRYNEAYVVAIDGIFST